MVLGAGAVSPAPVAVSTHVNRAAAILEQVKPNAVIQNKKLSRLYKNNSFVRQLKSIYGSDTT